MCFARRINSGFATSAFKPVSLLLYMDVLGTPETAQNQAQRIPAFCAATCWMWTFLIWCVLAKQLTLVKQRTSPAVFACRVCGLLCPQRRSRNGQTLWVTRDNGVPTVYNFFHVEKLRKFIKRLQNHEPLRKEVTTCLKEPGCKVFTLLLDSSSKWISTFILLEALQHM